MSGRLADTVAELYPEATAPTEAERTKKRMERLRAELEGDDYRSRHWSLETTEKGD